jgi:hypothetical protein
VPIGVGFNTNTCIEHSMGPSRASTHLSDDLFSLRMSTCWSKSVTEPVQN